MLEKLFEIRGLPVYKFSLEAVHPLIQLTLWLKHNEEEIQFIFQEYTRVSSDAHRTCRIFSEHQQLALFVNDVT